MEIDELVRKLESYHVVFVPNKAEYINFLFNFNARVIDRYYPNTPLCDHMGEFKVLVKSQIQDDMNRALSNYHRRNRVYKIWVPPQDRLERLVSDYIKYVKRNKK